VNEQLAVGVALALGAVGLAVYSQRRTATAADPSKAQSAAIVDDRITISGQAVRLPSGAYRVKVKSSPPARAMPVDPLTGQPSVLRYPRRKGAGWIDCHGRTQAYSPDSHRGKAERCVCRSLDGKSLRALRDIGPLLRGRPDSTMGCK